MRGKARKPSMRNPSYIKCVVSVATVLFWASAALMTVLVVLSWAAPGMRNQWSFTLLGGTCAGLALASSAFLFWQELHSNRQEMRAVRRENRDISVEEGNEWTPRALLYGLAFGFSFVLSWYLLPHLLFSL